LSNILFFNPIMPYFILRNITRVEDKIMNDSAVGV